MSSRAAGTSRLAIQPGTLLQSGWFTRDDKDTVEDYYFFQPTWLLPTETALLRPHSLPGSGDPPALAFLTAWKWGRPQAGRGLLWLGLGLGLELGGAKMERQGWGGREGGREAEREAGKEVARETGRQGGREGGRCPRWGTGATQAGGGLAARSAPLPGLSKPLSAALRAPHRRRLELHKSAL